MKWSIARARQGFSELLRKAATTPQSIYNRERLVAAVVDSKTFEEYLAWRSQKDKASLADAFTELRRILEEEKHTVPTAPRQDRDNAFAKALDELSR